MNEAVIRRWIQNALSRLGAYYYHAPDVNMKESHSRPDTIAITPFGSAVIEVKKCDIKKYQIGQFKGTWNGIYSFSKMNDRQRHLADALVAAGNDHYFAIGPVGGRFEFREIMVIPWEEWRKMENDHPDRTTVYWSTVKSIFEEKYALKKDEEGYYFPDYHPIVYELKCQVPFTWDIQEVSRRFEKVEEE